MVDLNINLESLVDTPELPQAQAQSTQRVFSQFKDMETAAKQKEELMKADIKNSNLLYKQNLDMASENITNISEGLEKTQALAYSIDVFDNIFSDREFETGAIEEWQMGIQRWLPGDFDLNMFRDVKDELSKKEMIAQQSNKIALGMAEQMKGALSDGDRQWLMNMSMSVGASTETNLRELSKLMAVRNRATELTQKFNYFRDLNTTTVNGKKVIDYIGLNEDIEAYKDQQRQTPLQKDADHIYKRLKLRRADTEELRGKVYPGTIDVGDAKPTVGTRAQLNDGSGVVVRYDGKQWIIE